MEAKYSGPRLVKVHEGNETVSKNFKKALKIDDDQFQIIKTHLSANFPQATLDLEAPPEIVEKPFVRPKEVPPPSFTGNVYEEEDEPEQVA